MVMDFALEDETTADTASKLSGKEKSDSIFSDLLLLSNTVSTAEDTLTAFQTSTSFSLSSSYQDTILPQISTNGNRNEYGHYPPRKLSGTGIGMSDTRHHSNYAGSPKIRRATWSMPKPSVFNAAREREKTELSSLNDKLADYVEKVRYLESQNKKIQLDANHLIEKDHEKSQKIKSLFDEEVGQLKDLAEKLLKEKNTVFSEAQSAQSTILPLKQCLNQALKENDSSKYETEKIERQLSSIEGDVIMYNRRLIHQDKELSQWKQWISHVQRVLLQAKNEIHGEHLKRSSCEQAVKQLQNDISRVRDEQNRKLDELKQASYILSSKSTNDRASMFKSELSHAIKRVRQDFERQNDIQRNELYKQYTQTYEQVIRQYPELNNLFLTEHEQDRIQKEEDQTRTEIQRTKASCELLKQKSSDVKLRVRELEINFDMSEEENKRILALLDNQIDQWKTKLDKIAKDYEDVMSKQISLKKEIETYRDLLEGTMKPVVDTITNDYNLKTSDKSALEQSNSSFNNRNKYLMGTPSNHNITSDDYEYNDDNDSFVSFMALNLNSKQPTSALSPPADISENLFDTNSSAENFFLEAHDHDQQIIEITDDVDY